MNLLNRFIVSKNSEKYESEIFEVDGFKFLTKMYPSIYVSIFNSSICDDCFNTNTK